jgi:hypothetical protein
VSWHLRTPKGPHRPCITSELPPHRRCRAHKQPATGICGCTLDAIALPRIGLLKARKLEKSVLVL